LFGLEEHGLLFLAVLAAELQALGYILYMRNGHIDPNPLTWLMFAYGTTVLTVLEFDRQASFGELLLPIVCAIMGVAVAVQCWLKARAAGQSSIIEFFRPKDGLDKGAFSADVVITVAYVVSWVLMTASFITESGRSAAALLFLIGSNLTTLTAFLPIIKSTIEEPTRERSSPWLVWTLAYGLLLLLTILNGNAMTELVLYPLSCTVLHGLVAWFARPSRRLDYRRAQTPIFRPLQPAANDAFAPSPRNRQQAA
jgi:hypothetical protein